MKITIFCLVILSLSFPGLAQNRGRSSKPTPSQYSSDTSSNSSWSSYGGQSHEVDINISKGEIHSYKEGNNNYTDLNIYGAYHYMLQSNIQLGGEGGLLASRDGNSSKSLIALMGIFTYNLDYDLTNSFFGQAGLGLYPAYDKTNGKTDSKFSFLFDFGKRITLWSHISYKPYLRIMKRGEMDMEFMVGILNFSLMF